MKRNYIREYWEQISTGKIKTSKKVIKQYEWLIKELDNPKLLGAPNDFDMTITDIKVSSGAGFIVVLMGNIMTMPGLGKNSAYLNMKIDNVGNISGLF